MSTPATFKSFGKPLQATSPFPLHAVHLVAKVALPVDLWQVMGEEKHDTTTCVTQSSPRSNSTGHGAKPIGSGTRTTDSRVASQLTVQSASCVPFPTS